MTRGLFLAAFSIFVVGCAQDASSDGPRHDTSLQAKKSPNDAKVELIVREVLGQQFKVKPESIDMKKLLSEAPLKADPLDVVQVVMTLEERFALEIPEKIIEKHGGAKLGETECKLAPAHLVRIVEESKELAKKKK